MFKPYNKAEIVFDLSHKVGKQGQNSETFVAIDKQLDAEIVIKSIQKSKLASPENFFDESKALYASAHPNVVQIYYACFDADRIYLAMPYYKRGSLADLVSNGFLTVREIIVIACQVLSALHNIHSKNLIHFDVKPDNILFSDRGDALLSDFGLAKQMNLSGVAYQDRFYFKMIPPEATESDHFTRAFDIYQFGLTLYRICNGEQQFTEQYARYGTGAAFRRADFKFDICNGRFPDRDAHLPHVPEALRKVINRCLAPAPADRFQSAIDVANALAPIDGEYLDWKYEVSDDQRIWTKNIKGTRIVFKVYKDDSTECLKAIGEGLPRKVGDGCQKQMTDRQIRTFLRDN